MSILSKLHIILILLLLSQITEQKNIKKSLKKFFKRTSSSKDISIDCPFPEERDDITINQHSNRIKIDIPESYCIEDLDFPTRNRTRKESKECIDLTDDCVDIIRIACKDKSEWTKIEPKNEKPDIYCCCDLPEESTQDVSCSPQVPTKPKTPKPSTDCLTFGQKICRTIIPCYQKINPCYEPPECCKPKKTCIKPHPLCECKQECPKQDTFVESIDPYDDCVCEVSGLIDIAAASVVKVFHCVKNHYSNIKGCRPVITWKTIEKKPKEKSTLCKRPRKWITWKVIDNKKKNGMGFSKILNCINPCKKKQKKKKSMFSCLPNCLSCRFSCPGLAKGGWSAFFPWKWAS